MDDRIGGCAAPTAHRGCAAGWCTLQALILRLTLLTVVLAAVLAGATRAAAATPPAAPPGQGLLLDAGTAERDLWDAMTVHPDPDAHQTLDGLAGRAEAFGLHPGQRGNLGRRQGAVWLRVPLQTGRDAAVSWLLEIDYAPLDRIDVHLLEGGVLRQQAVLGDHVSNEARAWPARSHVLPLELQPGRAYELVLRVQSTGSLLVPARLVSHATYAQHEAREQALQGLLMGMALCMMVYALSKWLVLRDAMFGLYALTLLGTAGFFAALSGMGPQHLWGGSAWLTRNGAPLFILIGVGGAFFFVLRALDVAGTSPIAARTTQVCGTLALGTAAGLAAGVVDYGTAQAVGMALGPMPLLLVLPTAWRRWREGDRAALYVMLGWGLYCVGVGAIVGLLAGVLPVNFWTLHGFQLGSTLEMTMWMMVLAHRVQEIRRDATRIRHESEHMRSLAHTDVLTGLLNRRGLEEAVPSWLSRCTAAQPVAVYLLDLDGFKQVNDTRGHACGDELLQAVAQRLREQVRPGDLICRLGGDEFVVCVDGLAPPDVPRVGQKLLRAFDEPFRVGGAMLRVASSVGCATAPGQGRELTSLLRRADEALYQGKAEGKGRFRTADPTNAAHAAL